MKEKNMYNFLKHEQLKKYIRGEVNDNLLNEVNTLKDNYIFFEAIFKNIDSINGKAVAERPSTTNHEEANFENVEKYIEELIAGNIDTDRQQRFVELLYHSPNFYNRLQTKLSQIIPLLKDGENTESNKIKIKSNDEIIAELQALSKNKSESNQNILKMHSAESHHLNHKSTVLRKFIYAAAAVLLIAPSIYFLNSQYQTAYKDQIVQNLLEDNYRIYMAEQPRLSGNYQSTGISQLMSGDNDSLNYLKQANEKVNEVLNYDPDDMHAMHLKAQIMILKDNYQKADSILNLALGKESRSPQMLNDLGVVYYGKKEWHKAKTFFKLSVKQDPNYPEAYYNLALTEIKLGNQQEAEKAIEKFLENETDPGWKNAGLSLRQTMEGN
jgi:hypothetical protein